MEGHHLTFFIPQDQTHRGMPLADWLRQEAERLGIAGASLVRAGEGFGHAGRLFAARFCGPSGWDYELTMPVTVAELQDFLARLRKEGIRVFYTYAQVDFGMSLKP